MNDAAGIKLRYRKFADLECRGYSVPVDVRDEDAVRWLMACVWPDHHERRRRLEGAIELARAQPPDVRAGDLVEDLPALLAEAPEDAQLVVFHSAVLSYVSPDHRRAFAAVLAEVSRRRDVVWVSNEGAGIIEEVAVQAPKPSELRFLLGRTRFANGRRHDQLLGVAHPHGAELTWLERGGLPSTSREVEDEGGMA